jgi:hypothetical protein
MIKISKEKFDKLPIKEIITTEEYSELLKGGYVNRWLYPKEFIADEYEIGYDLNYRYFRVRYLELKKGG